MVGSVETLQKVEEVAKTQSSLIGATKIVFDVFTNNNVKCAGRKKGEPPYITSTAAETITVDPEGYGNFVVHVCKIGDSGSSWIPRFRIRNPSLLKVDLDVDEKGLSYKRLEICGESKQVIIFERA